MFISKDQFTNQKLFDIYNSAFMQPSMDDDGDVVLRVDGVKMLARVSDRGFLVLWAGLGLKENATISQAIELCNRINSNMIMIRCYALENDPKPFLIADHWTMTDGGISGEEIVAVTRRFVNVLRDGISEYDSDDIVG